MLIMSVLFFAAAPTCQLVGQEPMCRESFKVSGQINSLGSWLQLHKAKKKRFFNGCASSLQKYSSISWAMA